MNTVPVPDNAIGRVGMVAALKRVNEADIGKLVVLREPAGMVTSLVGSDKPVFAWFAQALGEPIDCNDRPSRSIFIADACLIPISSMADADIENVYQAQVESDIDAALQDLKKIDFEDGITSEEFDELLKKAFDQASIERALEIVPIPVALREIGFNSSSETDDSLMWTGLQAGSELHFVAGCHFLDRWQIVATGNTPRTAFCDERILPATAQRGKIVSTVLSLWHNMYGRTVTPDCLLLGKIFDQHQSEMLNLNIGLPNLWAAPSVFRTIIKWLRPKYGYASPECLVCLSYNDGLLRIDADGTVFGCPAGGHWVDDCKVRLTDLLDMYESICRSRSIRLEQTSDFVLVNGLPIAIKE